MSDLSELERLRKKYGGAGGGDIFDPEFRRVAADQFKSDRRKLPYSDVATFMGLPYLANGIEADEFAAEIAGAARQVEHSRDRKSVV